MEAPIIELILKIFKKKLQGENRELLLRSIDGGMKQVEREEDEDLISLMGAFIIQYTGGWEALVDLYEHRFEEFSRYVAQAIDHFLKKQIRAFKGRESGESGGKANEGSFLYNKIVKAIKEMDGKGRIYLSHHDLSVALVQLPGENDPQSADWDRIQDSCHYIPVVERAIYINADKKRDPVIHDERLQELIQDILEAVGKPVSFNKLFDIVMQKVSWDKTQVVFLEDLLPRSNDVHEQSSADSGQTGFYGEIDKRVGNPLGSFSLERQQAYEQMQKHLLNWPEKDQMLLILFFLYGLNPTQLLQRSDEFGKQTFLYDEQKRLILTFSETYRDYAPDGEDFYEEVKIALHQLTNWLAEEGVSPVVSKRIESIMLEK